MPRFIFPAFALALLVACASPAPKMSPEASSQAATAVPEPAPKPVERAFPEDSIYPLLLAEFALRRRAYDVALDQYLAQAPLLQDPGVAAHATHLAQFMSREAEALEAVQLWVELEPENTEANNTLSLLLIRQGRSLEALPHLALLAKQGEQPNFPSLLSSYPQMSPQQRADLEQGIDTLAQEYPDNVQLLLTQAMMEAEHKQFESAQAKLERIFKQEPEQAQAAILEARILLARKSPKPYARVEQILREQPDDTQLRMQYARLLTSVDISAARAQFEILSSQSPRDGELLLSLALISRETGDNMEAKAYLRQLLALGQRTDDAHYYLGRIAEDEDDPQAAIYQYQQVEEGREFYVANGRISSLFISSGQFEENRTRFDQLRQEYPDRSDQLYGMQADLLIRAGQLDQAMAALNQAVAAKPDSTALRYARSMLAEQQDDLALMESDLREIIATDPTNATALNALGYTLANRTTRYDEAYQLISQALALEPGEPAILDSMGWVLYRMNRNDEAVDYLTQAYAAMPDAEVAAHLGEVLWVSGNTEGATAVWQGAALRDPDNAVLAETLERLGVTHIESPMADDPAGADSSGNEP